MRAALAAVNPFSLRRPPSVASVFDAHHNSIGFFRWLLAFSVIFSHAGPIAGFYGGHDLGTEASGNWLGVSTEQSLGGVAVAGFFFFSGFLITKSRSGRSSVFRYFWRRVLRIFPAFWLALLITAFVLAPIAHVREQGSIAGFWDARAESPLTYFSHNMFLELGQRAIAGMGDSIPFARLGGHDWNGSAWTLQYEFKAYVLVGVIGLLGATLSKYVGTVVALSIIAFNAMTWAGIGNVTSFNSFLADPFNMMLLAPFAFGMLFAHWGRAIPLDGRIAVVVLVAAGWTYAHGGWNVWGQYGLLYALMWAAVRFTWVRGWERFGDFSYGIYIFAWPLMTFATYFGLEQRGWWAYHLTIVVGVHVLACVSWHLVEKPAMSLKNSTPWPLTKLPPLRLPAPRQSLQHLSGARLTDRPSSTPENAS